MFEFIGMAVVAWVVWTVGKAIFRGIANGQRLRSSDFAITLGVPAKAALDIGRDHDTLMRVRNVMAKGNPAFKALDVYQQFGHAIHAIYLATSPSDDAELAGIREKIKAFLRPQVTILKCENVNICVNHISCAYICALAFALAGKAVDLGFVRQVLQELLPGEKHEFAIENAVQTAEGDGDFALNCRDLLPVAKKEIAQGKGEYFVKQIRKANQEIEAMFSSEIDFDYDPSKVSRKSLLDV